LMQIMPKTGRFIAANFQEDWQGNQALHEMDLNIRYGVWYLSYLHKEFPGNHQAAIAAYYWGPLNIQSRLRREKPLPGEYYNKIQAAEARLREEMYDFYKNQYWRGLDLSKN